MTLYDEFQALGSDEASPNAVAPPPSSLYDEFKALGETPQQGEPPLEIDYDSASPTGVPVGTTAVGGIEGLLNMLTGVQAIVPSSIQSVPELFGEGTIPERLGRYSTAVEENLPTWTYDPRTEGGKQVAEGIGTLFEKGYREPAFKGLYKAQELFTDDPLISKEGEVREDLTTGERVVAGGLKAFVETAPLLVGVRRPGKTEKAPKTTEYKWSDPKAEKMDKAMNVAENTNSPQEAVSALELVEKNLREYEAGKKISRKDIRRLNDRLGKLQKEHGLTPTPNPNSPLFKLYEKFGEKVNQVKSKFDSLVERFKAREPLPEERQIGDGATTKSKEPLVGQPDPAGEIKVKIDEAGKMEIELKEVLVKAIEEDNVEKIADASKKLVQTKNYKRALEKGETPKEGLFPEEKKEKLPPIKLDEDQKQRVKEDAEKAKLQEKQKQRGYGKQSEIALLQMGKIVQTKRLSSEEKIKKLEDELEGITDPNVRASVDQEIAGLRDELEESIAKQKEARDKLTTGKYQPALDFDPKNPIVVVNPNNPPTAQRMSPGRKADYSDWLKREAKEGRYFSTAQKANKAFIARAKKEGFPKSETVKGNQAFVERTKKELGTEGPTPQEIKESEDYGKKEGFIRPVQKTEGAEEQDLTTLKKPELMEKAKEYKITGLAKKTKAQLIDEIKERQEKGIPPKPKGNVKLNVSREKRVVAATRLQMMAEDLGLIDVKFGDDVTPLEGIAGGVFTEIPASKDESNISASESSRIVRIINRLRTTLPNQELQNLITDRVGDGNERLDLKKSGLPKEIVEEVNALLDKLNNTELEAMRKEQKSLKKQAKKEPPAKIEIEGEEEHVYVGYDYNDLIERREELRDQLEESKFDPLFNIDKEQKTYNLKVGFEAVDPKTETEYPELYKEYKEIEGELKALEERIAERGEATPTDEEQIQAKEFSELFDEETGELITEREDWIDSNNDDVTVIATPQLKKMIAEYVETYEDEIEGEIDAEVDRLIQLEEDYKKSLKGAKKGEVEEKAIEKTQEASQSDKEFKEEALNTFKRSGNKTYFPLVEGKEGKLKIPGTDKKIPISYRLMDMKDVQASHHWGDEGEQDFALNEEYPGNDMENEVARLQERQYHKDTTNAQPRIIKQRAQFNPDEIFTDNPTPETGLPILAGAIEPSGKASSMARVVLGGNSRALTVGGLYEQGKGGIVREAVKDSAEKFGISKEFDKPFKQYEKGKNKPYLNPPGNYRYPGHEFEQPMIVRVIDPYWVETNIKTYDQLKALINDLNRKSTAELNIYEEAVALSSKFSKATLDYFGTRIGEETSTLRSMIDRDPAKVLKLLREDGIINDQNVPSFYDQSRGNFTAEGKQKIERILTGQIINDPARLAKIPYDVMRRVSGALPAMLGSSSGHAKGTGWDMTEHVKQAVEVSIDAFAQNFKLGNGYDFLNQQTLFVDEGLGKSLDKMSPYAKKIFESFMDEGSKQFKTRWMKFKDLSDDAISGQGNMFDPTTPEGAFHIAFGDVTEQVAFQKAKKRDLANQKNKSWKKGGDGSTMGVGLEPIYRHLMKNLERLKERYRSEQPRVVEENKRMEAGFKKKPGARRAHVKFSRIRNDYKAKKKKTGRMLLKALNRGTIDVGGNIRRQLEKMGPAGKNAVQLHDLALGSSNVAKIYTQDLIDEVYSDLLESEQEIFENVLSAMRTISILEKRPEHRRPYGFTFKEAMDYLNNLTDSQKAKYGQRANRVHQYFKDALYVLHEKGLITDESYQALLDSGDYTPTNYIQYIDKDNKYATLGVTVPDSGIKKLDQGSEQALELYLPNLVADYTSRIYGRIMNNEANLAMARALKEQGTYKGTLGENFKRWFRGGKVVDEYGEPLAVYHGTSKAFDEFDTEAESNVLNEYRNKVEKFGALFFTDSPEFASSMSRIKGASGANVRVSYLDIKNPLKVSYKDFTGKGLNEELNVIKKAKAKGHDGIIVTHDFTFAGRTTRSQTQYIVFDKAQVRSKFQGDTPTSIIGRLPKKGEKGVPTGYEEFFYMEKGKSKRFFLSKDMAQEWVSYDPQIKGDTAKLISHLFLGSTLRFTATTGNPLFAFSNLPRDLFHGWFVSDAYSPHLPMAAKEMKESLAATREDAWNHDKPQGLLRKYLMGGGGMEFLSESGGSALLGQEGGRPSKLMAGFQVFAEKMSYIGKASELWVRLAIMHRMLKNGATETEAIHAARSYIDFARGGSFIKMLDHGIPYLNASMQATRGTFRAFEENPKKSFIKSLWLFGLAGALLIANRMTMDDDLDKVSTDERSRYLLLGVPYAHFMDENKNSRSAYVRIAKDQSQGVIMSIAEAFADYMIGNEFNTDIIKHAYDTANPAGNLTVLPPLLESLRTYTSGQDKFRGREVHHLRGKVKPEDETYDYINPAFDKIGRATGLSPARLSAASRKSFASSNPLIDAIGLVPRVMMEKTDGQGQKDIYRWLNNNAPLTNKVIRFSGTRDPRDRVLKESITQEVGSRRQALRNEMKRYLNAKQRGKAIGLIQKTRNRQDRERLKNQYKKWLEIERLGRIPEKPFFMDLVHATPEVAAQLFEDKLKRASPEMRVRLNTTLRRFRSLNTPTFKKERWYIQHGQSRRK
tara:strand:- start:1848 stop:9659 length:7812 start_codon:yes stop_codon:yes gene_type:complete